VPIINRSGEAVMTRPRAAALCAFLLAILAALPFVASPSPVGSQSGGLVPAVVAAEQAGAPASSGAPTLNGVDLTPLTPDQASTALQILGGTRCNCGCGMTLSECRSKDPKCSKSLTLAQGVVQDLKAGKDRATVQSNLTASLARLATPPPAATSAPAEDPNKVYKIDITGAPYKGPKGAQVVIVEFSDYQ
jgi:hypothetical protein